MRYLVFLLIAGCATTIDYGRKPPADWPALHEFVNRTTESDAKNRCSDTDLLVAYGCSIISFQAGTCTIYLATGNPETLAHEKMHCLGYDHVGETKLRDAWEKWKRERR